MERGNSGAIAERPRRQVKQRAANIRELAREAEASEDPGALHCVLRKTVRPTDGQKGVVRKQR